MQYRQFGEIGYEVSSLGFGCMRLPVIDSDYSRIDEATATRMLHYAIDHGVNYVDTAYPYHQGKSELFVGQALQGDYRGKVHLATKMPTWLTQTYADFARYLDEQLAKLQTDYLDVYLLHGLTADRWRKIRDLGVIDFVEGAVRAGKIRYIGFSFHDELPAFKEIADAYDWSLCQIQLNYMDTHYQAGLEGLRYAGARGIPVVVMEPLRGGKLANNLPPEVQAVWGSAPVARTPAEWAFRWVLDFPEVATVLSGMSTEEQVVENVNIFSAPPSALTEAEKERITAVQAIYRSKTRVGCTDCGYCLPCTAGVEIPDIFSLYNNASMYNTAGDSVKSYREMISQNKDASHCIRCRKCEEACPQNLPITRHLQEAHQEFTGI